MRHVLFVTVGLFIVFSVSARTIVVPHDAPTVQSGLDSLQDLDTLLISVGTYEELLIAPPIRFTMIGEVRQDSLGQTRPILDGTNVPAADSSAVLRLPLHSALTIRDLVIRNEGRGGIFCWADSLIVSNCIFERIQDALWYRPDSIGAFVRIDSSTFADITGMGVAMRRGNCLVIRNSHFHAIGDGDAALVGSVCSDIESCTFSGTRMLLGGVFGPHVVRNCVFGPAQLRPSREAVYLSNGVVEFTDNVFQDCIYGYHALYVYSNSGDSVSIRNNTFIRCIGLADAIGAQGAVGTYTPFSIEPGAQISGNSFVECAGIRAVDCIASSIHAPALIVDNLFQNDSINGLPSISAGNPQWQQTPVTLRDNRWENCGYAVDLSAAADARFNYWGHNSGPYHAVSNPFGQGDTITGDVPFIPWLEDTTDAIGNEPEVPEKFNLQVYPNPFNASTRLSFSIQQVSQVELTVYDLMGRSVWSTSLEHLEAGEHSVVFDSHNLSSGVYFAKLATHGSSISKKLVLLK